MVGVVAQDVQIDRLATKPLAHPILTEVLAVRTDQQREITQLLAELTHLRLRTRAQPATTGARCAQQRFPRLPTGSTKLHDR